MEGDNRSGEIKVARVALELHHQLQDKKLKSVSKGKEFRSRARRAAVDLGHENVTELQYGLLEMVSNKFEDKFQRDSWLWESEA